MNTVCYVFVRHLPHTLNPGKLAAQVHHIGVKMMVDDGKMKLVKDHVLNDCGTTIVLQTKELRDTERQIWDLIHTANALQLPCGFYIDPTYPVDFDLTCECLTCGYILLDKDSEDGKIQELITEIQNNWELYR